MNGTMYLIRMVNLEVTGNEIRTRIVTNNEIIEKAAREGTFQLSKEAQAAINENIELRKKCDHLFDDLGYCVYCDWRED